MKPKTQFLHALVVILVPLTAVIGPARLASAVTEEKAQSQLTPWSGWWWPIRHGGILKPLGKYDQISGRESAQWEAKRHSVDRNTPEWAGYCHATAAAAVSEKEPARGHKVPSQEGTHVNLGIGDQKALLNACHTADHANIHGDRYGDGIGDEDKNDLTPDRLVYLLRFYLKQQQIPLILDIEEGKPVWNYPVYAYELRYWPKDDAGLHEGELSLLMADMDVPADFQGLKPFKKTYQFTIKIQNGALVMGSGQWLGRSRKDHPDFAWYPYAAQSENPEVVYAEVQQLVATATPEPAADDTTESDTTNQPEPEVDPEAETQPNTETSPENQPSPEVDPDPESDPAPDAQPVTETPSDNQPEAESQPVPVDDSVSDDQPATEPQPADQPATQPQPQPVTQPKPQPEQPTIAESTVEPRPQPETRPESTPETETQVDAVSTPRPQPNDQAETAEETPVENEASVKPPGDAVVVSPMELVAMITGKTSSFLLDVTVEGFDGATYRMGDTFTVRCASQRRGYLYLIYLNKDGGASLLFPQAGQDNRVPANRSITVPRPKTELVFGVDGPAGIARVKALVTTRPLVLSGRTPAGQGPSQHRSGTQQKVVQPTGFRWNPTQKRQIQALLEQYQKTGKVAPDNLAGIDLKRLLGPFAQDEVVFYVEPNERRGSK